MSFDSLAVQLLLSISTFLGISELPGDKGSWAVEENWHYTQSEGFWKLKVSSTNLSRECRKKPESYVQFPMIIQGGYKIFVDGSLILTDGNIERNKSTGYYGIPDLKCNLLLNAERVTIEAYSYLRYYARMAYFPRLVDSRPTLNFFARQLNLIVGGCLFFLGLFSFMMFRGKIKRDLNYSILFSNLFMAIYFLFSVIHFLPTQLSDILVHKVGLAGLWTGVIFLFYSFFKENIISRRVLGFYITVAVLGILMTILGESGDSVQLGTNIIFGPTLFILLHSMYFIIKSRVDKNISKKDVLQIISLLFFITCSINDISMVVGLTMSVPLISLGVFGSQYFFSLAVNEQIEATYVERDYLRENLEREVIVKTNELKAAQAELVQSAKLVSLGTLAAGLAHEINNSINYVNGALVPLQRIISDANLEENKKTKAVKLVGVMKEGLNLTIDIIKNLRNFSGLNQAPSKEANLKEIMEGVLVLLKSRIRADTSVEIEVPENLILNGNVVGLNQIFMNLISNSLDAMPNGGRLSIVGGSSQTGIEISISDNGMGIPAAQRDRVFDPFYTTKEVGKGTGLGLHIVKKEIEKHGGAIHFESEVGKGTRFVVTFPVQASGAKIA